MQIDDKLIGLIFSYGTMAVILVLVLGISYYQRQKRNRAWSEFSGLVGLTFEPGNIFSQPKASGTYRGHSLLLESFTRGAGRSRTTYTRLAVAVDNRSDINLGLYQEGMFSKIGKAFGSQDIQVGDPEVDQKFIIRSKPEEFAMRLFSSVNLRSKLLQLRPVNIVMAGSQLTYERVGTMTDLEQLRFLADLLLDLGDFIERA